jgi:hypothetical protein
MIPNPPTHLIDLTKFCGSGINNSLNYLNYFIPALSVDSEKLFVNCSVLYNKESIEVCQPASVLLSYRILLRVAKYTGTVANLKLDNGITLLSAI